MLSDGERRFLAHQRIAHLATADNRAVPHVVPVCFAMSDATLYITIDEKPKRSSTALKRLRNIAESPAVAVVVDRYAVRGGSNLRPSRVDGDMRSGCML
jgi:PPOX class probable F420-dependent enzyme